MKKLNQIIQKYKAAARVFFPLLNALLIYTSTPLVVLLFSPGIAYAGIGWIGIVFGDMIYIAIFWIFLTHYIILKISNNSSLVADSLLYSFFLSTPLAFIAFLFFPPLDLPPLFLVVSILAILLLVFIGSFLFE